MGFRTDQFISSPGGHVYLHRHSFRGPIRLDQGNPRDLLDQHAPRGAYCGVLGYFDDAGHADFNILIRTIAAAEQGAICWGGGGIVMDSTWEDEWQEIHSKVGRILSTPL